MIWRTDDLNPSWPTKPLVSLTSKVGSGATPRGGRAAYPERGVPLIRSQNVHFDGFHAEGLAFLNDTQAQQLAGVTVAADDVLLNITGASIGRACIAPPQMDGARVNQHVCIIRPVGIRSSFLASYLASPQVQDAIGLGNYGVTREALTKSQILELPVPVPTLEAQDTLVTRTSKISAHRTNAIQHLTTVRRTIERFRQSVLLAACSGRLTDDWRHESAPSRDVHDLLRAAANERRSTFGRKYFEVPGPDVSQLSCIPEGWAWTPLSSLVRRGPQNGLYLPQSKYGSGTAIFRIDDYQLDWSRPSDELKRVEVSASDLARYSLQQHDIIINRVNSPSHLGKAMFVGSRHLPALFESNMMRISLVSVVEPAYVTFFLQSMYGRQLLTKNAKWAVNQASINQKDVNSTPIPLPPLGEQKEIVRRVQALLKRVDELLPVIDRVAASIDRSEQAVLAKAFRGELISREMAETSVT